jgi:hypothetical protein
LLISQDYFSKYCVLVRKSGALRMSKLWAIFYMALRHMIFVHMIFVAILKV